MWDQTETRSSLNDNLCLSSSFTLQCFPHVIIGFSWENSLSTSINPSKTLLLGTPTQDNPKVAWFTSRSQVYVCFIPGPTAGLNHCLKWLAGIFCSLFSWREKFLVRQWCWQSYMKLFYSLYLPGADSQLLPCASGPRVQYIFDLNHTHNYICCVSSTSCCWAHRSLSHCYFYIKSLFWFGIRWFHQTYGSHWDPFLFAHIYIFSL